VFNQIDLSSNPEVFLWRQYSQDLKVAHNLSRYIPFLTNSKGISKSLVDSYLCTDKKDISASTLYSGDGNYADYAKNRDSRLKQTVIQLNDVAKIPSATDTLFYKPPLHPALDKGGAYKSVTGYNLYKGNTLDYSQFPSYKSVVAYIHIRYAEVLLNYAEAKAELGTLTQADLGISINLLRKRVGMQDMLISDGAGNIKAFPNKSTLINEIRRERRVELACEGYRLDDLMRWRAHHLIVGKLPRGFKYVGSDIEGTLLTKESKDRVKLSGDGQNVFVDAQGYISPYIKTPGMEKGWQFDPTRDYLLPIPLDELVLNKKLTQNPKWKDASSSED
jgi:hypothetical protein